MNVSLLNPVRKVVLGERRVWKTSENSSAVAPVMSGKSAPMWKYWDEKCYWIVIVELVFVKTDDGEDDLKKGTQLLEIYALEIQMYTAQKNNKKLKALYEQSLHIKSAIPHPLIMGVIRGILPRTSYCFLYWLPKCSNN